MAGKARAQIVKDYIAFPLLSSLLMAYADRNLHKQPEPTPAACGARSTRCAAAGRGARGAPRADRAQAGDRADVPLAP